MLTAVEAVALLRSGQVSSRELVEAALLRIEQVDAELNALPTLCAERALDRAGGVSRDAKLAGLPIAVKDLNDVAGVRTTYGSPIYADHVPDRSDFMVERLEQRGAVVVAKSNTPEFGAGANTFNEVFGETRNPWDTSRTCGGSSGGSAAALASGQVWLGAGSHPVGAPRPRWPAARYGGRPDPPWAAACAPRPGSAASWESGPAPAGLPPAPPRCRSRRCRWRGRWAAPWPMQR